MAEDIPHQRDDADGFHHLTVMAEEVVDCLTTPTARLFVDGTLGGGGHAEALLERAKASGVAGVRLIGVDRDPDALAAARARLSRFGQAFEAVEGNYGDLPAVLAEQGIDRIDGLVIDAGVSSHQLDVAERGFSFSRTGPLDMRMGQKGRTAAELIDEVSVEELGTILYRYGEVRGARRLAGRIKRAREEGKLSTTTELADLCGRPRRTDRIHPATQVFQALRIAVNDELTALEDLVASLGELLAPGGRAAFISFHSLEDRIVKHGLKALARGCVCPPGLIECVCGQRPRVKLLGGLRRPGEAEVDVNPRARSARLRCAERLEDDASREMEG